ncbi:MAG: SPOR domain-containing protein [Bacteroidales bacterium]|nr:SPOR domain-containing protein [Bacteroidales bacterium]MBN2821113.1 SPOR domain-containing protein [Bacteroidales bacterium]
MKTIRLALIVLVLTSLTSCKLFKSKKTPINDLDTSYMIDEPEVEPIDTLPIETIVQETEPVKPNEPLYGYTDQKFYMVVGSFISEKLAYKYATKMLDLGYAPQIIYSSSIGYYRVSAQSYNNYQTAVNDIAVFRDNVTPKAWVHVKRN